MDSITWLPKLEPYDGSSDWIEYSDYLYAIFLDDFINSIPIIKNTRVAVKKYPTYNDKHEAYFHITCKNYNYNDHNAMRDPDLNRCARIRWPRAFIDNYDSSNLLVWKAPYKSTHRINIMFKEKRYIVVLEDRTDYYLLITAYYFDYQNAFARKIKEYKTYKNNKI